MNPKAKRRLEDLESKTEASCRPLQIVIRDNADGTVRNADGSEFVAQPGARVLEISIVDPPQKPPWTNFEPTAKPQVRH
jgi:hypothetical protein